MNASAKAPARHVALIFPFSALLLNTRNLRLYVLASQSGLIPNNSLCRPTPARRLSDYACRIGRRGIPCRRLSAACTRPKPLFGFPVRRPCSRSPIYGCEQTRGVRGLSPGQKLNLVPELSLISYAISHSLLEPPRLSRPRNQSAGFDCSL